MHASEFTVGFPNLATHGSALNDSRTSSTASIKSSAESPNSAKKGMGLFAILKRNSEAAGLDLGNLNAKKGMQNLKEAN